MYRSFCAMLLVWTTFGISPVPVNAETDEFTDVTMDLWQSVDLYEQLHVCAGINKDGDLMLIEYDVVHFLPSAPDAGDGGVDVRPRLKTRSLDGARIQTIDGKDLSLDAFGQRFATKSPNALRSEGGSNIREFHSLVIVLEHSLQDGKHRPTPSHFRQVFRPDLPVISLPRIRRQPIEIQAGSVRP